MCSTRKAKSTPTALQRPDYTYVSTSVSAVQRLFDRFPPKEAETQERSCKVSQTAYQLSCVSGSRPAVWLSGISALLRCRQIEKKEREAKLQERAEVQLLPQAGSETGRVCQQQASCRCVLCLLQRKQALREKLNLDQFESDSDAPDTKRQHQDGAKSSSVSVHEFGQYSAVVTVEPFSMHSDRSAAISPMVSAAM